MLQSISKCPGCKEGSTLGVVIGSSGFGPGGSDALPQLPLCGGDGLGGLEDMRQPQIAPPLGSEECFTSRNEEHNSSIRACMHACRHT